MYKMFYQINMHSGYIFLKKMFNKLSIYYVVYTSYSDTHVMNNIALPPQTNTKARNNENDSEAMYGHI